MAELIQYWDDTLKKYVEVSTTTPLPTNAVGGGSGGAEEVEITSAGGSATTAAPTDGMSGTDVGLNTNSRNYGYNGATWDRVHAGPVPTQTYPATPAGLWTNSRNMYWDGTAVRLQQGDINGISYTATPHVGTEGNGWNNVAVLANGVSTAIDFLYVTNISIFGKSTAITTIEIEVSQNNVNFYKTGLAIEITAPDDFFFGIPNMAARYIRLRSDSASTITATLVGNG